MTIEKVVTIMADHGIICRQVGKYDILLLDINNNIYDVVSWYNCLLYDCGTPCVLKHWPGY